MQGKVIWTVSYNKKILAKQIITDILIQSVHKSKVLRPIVLTLTCQNSLIHIGMSQALS